jgi:hypothetical protein
MNRMQKLVLTIAVVAAVLIPLWLLVAVPERGGSGKVQRIPEGKGEG